MSLTACATSARTLAAMALPSMIMGAPSNIVAAGAPWRFTDANATPTHDPSRSGRAGDMSRGRGTRRVFLKSGLRAGYNARLARDTRNTADNIYGNQTVLLLALQGDNASGYSASISLGVNVEQVNSGSDPADPAAAGSCARRSPSKGPPRSAGSPRGARASRTAGLPRSASP